MTELVELEIEQRGDAVIARVTGELDIAGARGLGDRLHDAVPTSARTLVIDFRDLDFIDSSGIAMLFALSRKLGSRRQRMRVVAPAGRAVARVLEIVEFERAAPVYETLEEALAATDQ